jgi:transposase
MGATGTAGELPEGTVTFLFTDLEGSTRLLEAHPAAYREAVRRHHDLRREAVEAHGGVLLSLPGLDARLAARILGEVGDDGARFLTPGGLQCYAGTAPVTRASGKARVVAARFACNRFLRQAVLTWAVGTLRLTPWARAHYDRLRQAGKTHHSALRALGNRWLEILHHLLATGMRYDDAVHERNRARFARPAAA